MPRRSLILSLVVVLSATSALADVRFKGHVQAAAARFSLSPELIEAVIAAESGGQTTAVSSAGAMGLMQLMPATWDQLRTQLSLGSDPFDPADNILAGAAYLKALRDRYGAPGFLAAYNAGPGRYEESLRGRPLPLETQRYVERLSGPKANALGPPIDWRASGLFAPSWAGSLGAAGRGSPASPLAALFATRRQTDR